MVNVWKLLLCGDLKEDCLKENTQQMLKQKEANDFKLLLSDDTVSKNSFLGKACFAVEASAPSTELLWSSDVWGMGSISQESWLERPVHLLSRSPSTH